MPEMPPERKYAVDIPTSPKNTKDSLIYAGDEEREEHPDHSEGEQSDDGDGERAFHTSSITNLFTFF